MDFDQPGASAGPREAAFPEINGYTNLNAERKRTVLEACQLRKRGRGCQRPAGHVCRGSAS